MSDHPHVEDLALARACGAGDGAAVRAFERDYRDTIRAVIGRMAPGAVDEVAQRVLAKLLVGSPPAIVAYSGRGTLRAWVRVVATREAYDHLRAAGRERHEGEEALDELVAGDDPELGRIKQKYRQEFRRGFAAAFEALDVRERNVLRHEHLDALSSEQIGALYGVHRATVARWRADARDKLASGTRRFFREEVRVPAGEVDSIFRLIGSQLDVSLSRLLGSGVDDDR